MTRGQIIEATTQERLALEIAKSLMPEDEEPRQWMIDLIEAAFESAEALGYVVVPVIPTEHMIDIGACHEDQDHDIFDEGHIATEVYRAMIEAGKV